LLYAFCLKILLFNFDISLSIKLDKEPKALFLQPQGRELSYEYKDGRAYTTVERLDIHSVIQVMPHSRKA
jgi:hypothetical protein